MKIFLRRVWDHPLTYKILSATVFLLAVGCVILWPLVLAERLPLLP